MQFSKAFVAAFLLALTSKVFAAENTTSTEDVEGTSSGVEFPFSDDAIIEAIALGEDVFPIVLDDAVYFVNATLVEQELGSSSESDSQYSKREAEADAWRWKHYFAGQPFYKRSESGLAKRSAEADAEADAWRWKHYFAGQPFYKREAEADAAAEAWRWKHYFAGQPFY